MAQTLHEAKELLKQSAKYIAKGVEIRILGTIA